MLWLDGFPIQVRLQIQLEGFLTVRPEQQTKTLILNHESVVYTFTGEDYCYIYSTYWRRSPSYLCSEYAADDIPTAINTKMDTIPAGMDLQSKL
jgi:hypothetical protein